MSFNAYVYVVKNKLTGEFYYGYRSANIPRGVIIGTTEHDVSWAGLDLECGGSR